MSKIGYHINNSGVADCQPPKGEKEGKKVGS